MSLSTRSFFLRDNNNSTANYAIAANHSSYKYYNNMTWSMWLAVGPGTNKDIWTMFEDTATDNRAWHFSTQDDGSFRVILSADGTGISLHKTATSIFNFSWINVVVTFAGSTPSVYVNNVLQSLTEVIPYAGGALHSAGQRLLIGAQTPSSPSLDQAAGGCYSNFSMWNKVLDSDEREELLNDGVPADLSQHSAYSSLTNWYRLDQSDTAPTLVDSKAGAGANMTIVKSGTSPFFNPSDNHADVLNLAADVKHGVMSSTGLGTYRGYDLWQAIDAADLAFGVTTVQDGADITGEAVLFSALTFREKLNTVMAFIGDTSLTDDEYDALTITVFALDNVTYQAMLAVLDVRESVSSIKARLAFYFKAKGVSIDESADLGKSNIFLGSDLC